MRAFALSLLALSCAAPALAAEGGTIRSGEQQGFSRIVLQIEPTTEWSLETGGRRATIFFPRKQINFGTAGVFDRIPRTRITNVTAETGEDGTRITVDLGCDCRVSTAFVAARYLALDVADRTAETDAMANPDPQAGAGGSATADRLPSDAGQNGAGSGAEAGAAGSADPDALATREAADRARVYGAEEALLRQIERAAAEGLLTLPEPIDTVGPVDRAAANPDFAGMAQVPPAPEPAPVLPLALEAPGGTESAIPGRAGEAQIEATTVFERYSARNPDRIARASLPAGCIPDDRLDIGFWASGQPFPEQVAQFRQRLVGEFDKMDPIAVNGLARVYIRFGLGAEAEALLTDFAAEGPDKRLLVDLARVMDGRAVAPYGPLSRGTACPGRHGMWLAIAGVAPAWQNPGQFATVQEAFSDLPPDLRMQVGPRLIENLLDSDRPTEARLIFDTLTRVGNAPSAGLVLATARLTAAEGDPASAIRMMSGLVEKGAPNALDALTHMVELGLASGFAIPDRTLTDLRAAALENRGTAREPGLRALVAKALAARGEMETAITELRAATASLGQADYFNEVAVQVLAATDPDRVGQANYARITLAATDMVSETPADDLPRVQIARKLLDLGLAKAAETMVAPAAGRVPAGRLLLAQAYLTQGETERTRQALAGLQSREAGDLRARSHFLDGDFAAAEAELDAAGLKPEAEALAWPAGNWPRAGAAADSPEEAAMAEFMAARAGLAEARAPAADPAQLAPDEAFLEPLPQLQDPSLDAARRLLATGDQLEAFIQSILAPDDQESR